MGLVSRIRHSADDSRRDVCCQSSDRNHFLDSGVGLGSCDQRSAVACKLVLGLQLARILFVPSKSPPPRMTGYLLIRHPDAGAAGVTMLLAALFIVGGLFRAAAASAIQFPRWGWTVFSGVISVALGVFLWSTWPTASTYFIGIAIGIDLILDGSALVGFAGAIHSLPRAQARTA